MVTERRREIGIRMALGADRASVLRMVLRQGLVLTVVGIAGGLAVAFAMNRVLASLLFGVRPSDPATMGAVVGIDSDGGVRRLLPAGAAGDAGGSDDRAARGLESGFSKYVVSAFRRTSREVRLKPDTTYYRTERI
jgi:ABC-type antimicrobial peptide transport system permease subunit